MSEYGFDIVLPDIDFSEDEVREFVHSRPFLALLQICMEKRAKLYAATGLPNLTDRQASLAAGKAEAFHEVATVIPRLLAAKSRDIRKRDNADLIEAELREQLRRVIDGYFGGNDHDDGGDASKPAGSDIQS